MGYKVGQPRGQMMLFPVTPDELIPANHLMRLMGAFVDRLDLTALGFTKAQVTATDHLPYHPRDLLKLYGYGYHNEFLSSRELERQAGLNEE